MQGRRLSVLILGAALLLGCSSRQSPVAGKLICLDPGHGGTAAVDTYRVSPGGEREEWINLRVALLLRQMLEARGARVLITRTEDVEVPLAARAQLAVDSSADVFLSIHHNATADPQVNFPVVYFHGNACENRASVLLGRLLLEELARAIHSPDTPASLASDHTIFPVAGTAVLRNSYGIPGVIAEASFFSNPEEGQRLRSRRHNRREAEAYVRALERFFSREPLPILAKNSLVKVDTFRVLQEAERMSEVARRWRQDFERAQRLATSDCPDSLRQAYLLFTRSARSFPDSYLARECHLQRARSLRLMGDHLQAEMTERRVAVGRSQAGAF